MKEPKIRFKGFTDDWEQRKFGEITIRESKTEVSSSELPSVEYEDVIVEEGLLNKDISLKEEQKKGIAFDGSQVLYGKLRPYLHNWLNTDFTGVAVGDWWVLRPINVNKNFLFRIIQTKQFDDIANQSAGSKMPRADWKLVSETEFLIPNSIEEQEQIGNYFQYLDHLITLHQRKCEQMKNLKKFMLQKMFPKNGQKFPKIRFSGFTDAWEQRKLGEVCQINGRIGFRGYTEADIIPKEKGGVLTFTPTNIVDNQLTVNVRNTYITRSKYDESPEIMVHNGNILFVKTGSTLGKSALVAELDEDATVNPQVVVIKVKYELQKILSTILMTDIVQKQIVSVKIGGAVPTMTETELKNISLCIPNIEHEKLKIGQYFSCLDHLITLHQRKCEKLQELKKFMLQNMFV